MIMMLEYLARTAADLAPPANDVADALAQTLAEARAYHEAVREDPYGHC